MTDSRLDGLYVEVVRSGTPDARLSGQYLSVVRAAPSWPPAITESALSTSAPDMLFEADVITPDWQNLIQAWVDQGTGRHDANATSAAPQIPAWVSGGTPLGLPSAVFDGNDNMSLSTTDGGSSSQTIMAIVRNTSISGTRSVLTGQTSGLQLRFESQTLRTVKQGVAVIASCTTTFLNNTWYVIAATHVNGTSYSFFVDGVAAGSGSHSTSLSASSTRTIGANGNSEFFVGDLPAIAAWNRVLTTTEIQDITTEWTAKYLVSPGSGYGYWGILLADNT